MTNRSTILVTGGAGFIGSHTCLELLNHGYEVVVVDNHDNSFSQALERVQKLAGRPLSAYEVDIRDHDALSGVFAAHPVDAVIHFAAKKAVAESMRMPLVYYDTNVGGTATLLRVMHSHDVHRMVFSSSCSIYGHATRLPLDEDCAAAPTNPYARAKWICEQMLADACVANRQLSVIALRYFNPAGAHPSGELADYPTLDGTCIRDYIHVVDLADGHRLAVEHLADETGLRVLNLGTGVGVSVLELVTAFGEVCGTPLPYRIAERRPGDVPELIADSRRVKRAWGWRTTRDVAAMCTDAWRFQRLHPAGYAH